ncbi:hypothetical protein MMC19_002855 [Ptychographa xylographoides]|nr:hypothetical protein [Ptychographa xylographoides]
MSALYGIADIFQRNQSWEGPDDPLHPRNWSARNKWTNVLVVSGQATIAPIALSFFAVADLAVAEDFHITNVYLPSLPVAIFVLGLGLGPLYLAPCSELYGRRVVYLFSFALFTIFNAGCALAPNMAILVVLRFFCGIAGSAGPGLGAGTVSDVFAPESRGRAQAIYGLGPQGGPVLGGVLGGFILDVTGTWRWLLWIMTIASGVMTFLSLCFLQESYEPFLLKQKAKRMRKQSGNDNYKVVDSSDNRPQDLFLHSITRPFRMLLTIPICTVLSLYTSL